MKRFSFLILIAIFSVIVVSAGSYTFSGIISPSDYDRDVSGQAFYGTGTGTCNSTTYGSSIYSDEYSFYVTASGVYTLNITNLIAGDGTIGAFFDTSYGNCIAAFWTANTGPTINVTLNTGTTYILNIWPCDGGSCVYNGPYNYDMTLTGPGNICVGTSCTVTTNTTGTTGLPEPFANDGRINGYDAAAPVVVYGQDMDGGRGLILYSDAGAHLLVVTPDLLIIPETGNQLIASNEDAEVYVFMQPDGQWHIQARTSDGKWYHLMTSAMYAHETNYSSWSE